MSDGEFFAWILIGAFCLIAIGAAIVDYEYRKAAKWRRKPNVRVPRETLWARTNRYHGDRT
jgi:hypothetical protein